jgi:hypothetical protein
MPVPRIVDDGNYFTSQFNGPPSIVYPFEGEGDTQSWEMTPRIWIDQSTWTKNKPTLGSKVSTSLGEGYVCNVGEPSSVGSGLYEYRPTYCSLPISRLVAASIIYNLELLDFASTTGQFTIRQIPLVRNGYILHEYSLTPLTVLEAPQYIPGFIGLPPEAIGNWGAFEISNAQTNTFAPSSAGFTAPPMGANLKVSFVPSTIAGQQFKTNEIILAEDCEMSIYKGFAYYRQSKFVPYPNLQALT